MVDLRPNDFVSEGLEDMAVVTGIPRSGTSILGQLVGTFSTVEYAYEPPMINYFDARCRHGLIDPASARDAFVPYLYFEHFVNYLHGRRYSFRQGDFSYVLGMKPVPEVVDKWQRVNGIQDAVELAPDHTFVFKYPGFYDLLSALYDGMESMTVVDIGRGLDRIAASLYDKEWFFDQNLQEDSAGRWPYHDTDGVLAPYLVRDEDVDSWQSMTPETRTIYVCNRFAEDRLAFVEQYANRPTYREVRYERLLEEPGAIADELADFVGCARGPLTQDVVDEIHPTSPPADLGPVLDTCDDAVQRRFEELRPRIEEL